ncbi:MAG: cytochrome c family protein, partial [Desulfobacterales bacterium]|nr:cytochrome c family protein [Desulfobacterales bacterium]
MMKEKSLFRRTGLVLTLVALMLVPAMMSVQGSAPSAPSSDDADRPRADIIRIDGLKQFGTLERPAVVYLHEKHTQALSKKNKDCATCHLPDQKYMSTKFKRLTDVSKIAVMDIYHDNCTACHRQTAGAGEKAGPVVCAGC